MNADPKRKIARKREPKFKGPTKHTLTATVNAVGAEEAGFLDEGMPEGGKWRWQAKNEGERG